MPGHKCDVWSFGILLYELITYGSSSYPSMTDAEVIEALKTGYRMPCPDGSPEQLYEMMKECWRDEGQHLKLCRAKWSSGRQTLNLCPYSVTRYDTRITS